LNMSTTLTPLRYPGGKSKLFPLIKNILYSNSLLNGVYVEPFSGGAGISICLLLNNLAEKIVINDIDYAIYAFWKTLKDRPYWLCDKISSTTIDIDTWNIQRNINANKKNYSIYDVGFSTFFLNRTNRSGIIRGGVIGGRKQASNYKIDARFNKNNLIKKIESIATYRDRINLYNLDAIKLVEHIKDDIGNNSLIYFDPPYFQKGNLLYTNFYKENDHKILSKYVKKLKTPWIVTYDNVDKIKQIYNQDFIDLRISYSASSVRSKGKEILFWGNIEKPQLEQ